MFSDQPLRNSNNDLFDRKSFSQRIAHIIANRTEKESIVIGIHAPWGEGKTSVLNMIIENLDEYIQKKDGKTFDGHLVLLKFNPWRYSDENQLLMSFFFALAEALDKDIKKPKRKIGEKIKKYAWLASPLDGLKLDLGGLVDAKFDAQKVLEKIGEELSQTDIEKLKKEIENILHEENRKVIVIMDDIDRLDKEEIQAVFKLVKLTADFVNTIYILSFDVDRVSEALKDKYGSKEAGRSFLEKIIQLSLPLPPVTSDKLIKLAFNEINKLLRDNSIEVPKNSDDEWSYFFITTFGSYLKSPRLVKKYINNLWFKMAEGKNELNILDLQTIEAVQVFFPDLYDLIRRNKNVFLLEPSNKFLREDEEKEHIEELKRMFSNFPETEVTTLRKIVQEIFPRTSRAFSGNSYGTGTYDEWAKQKRIASPIYFQRYFNLGIDSDDIGDNEYERFIYNLLALSDEKNSSEIEKLVSNNRADLFLQKTSLYLDDLNEKFGENLESSLEDRIVKLAKALALSGGLFIKGSSESILLGLSPFSNAARLLRHLVETVEKNHQHKLSIMLASMAAPLDFAAEFFRFAKYIGRDKNDQSNELNDLGKAVVKEIVKRIEIEAEEEYLENRYPQASANLYRQWWFEKKENLIKHLEKRFKENLSEAESFVLSFYKQNWAVSGAARLFGFDFVVSAIEKSHPEMKPVELDDFSEEANYLVNDEEKYLTYFVSIAKAMTKSRNEI